MGGSVSQMSLFLSFQNSVDNSELENGFEYNDGVEEYTRIDVSIFRIFAFAFAPVVSKEVSMLPEINRIGASLQPIG